MDVDFLSKYSYISCRNIEVIHHDMALSCLICELRKVINNQTSLKASLRVVHESVKDSCNECEFQAENKIKSKSHLRFLHKAVELL